MMEPKDIQEEYADALRALLEKNTIARRRNLWDVFCRAIARAEAAEADVARLTAENADLRQRLEAAEAEAEWLRARLAELEDFLSAYKDW